MSSGPGGQPGEAAAAWVEDGMTLGLGTGSTVYWTLRAIGRRVAGGLRVRGVPTSRGTEATARNLGIPLVTLEDVPRLDLTIDGADEASPALDLVKGGGGALLREKLVALASDRRVIVVDRDKLVERLGRGAIPVEVVGFGWRQTAARLERLGGRPELRLAGGLPFVTDEGHRVLDCTFGPVDDPAGLEAALKAVPGVVESGLFVGLADTLVIGDDGGAVEVRSRPVG